MTNHLRDRLELSFQLYADLIDFIPEDSLSRKLPGLPSNELGAQLWCVVGARNSHVNALKAGKWVGFECPLTAADARSSKAMAEALDSTAKAALDLLQNNVEFDSTIALQLLEHEIQHHGQIIRYLYGLKLGIPESWKSRYNLD